MLPSKNVIALLKLMKRLMILISNLYSSETPEFLKIKIKPFPLFFQLILINDTTKASEAKRRSIIRLLTFIFTTSIFLFVAVVLWFLNSSPKEFAHDFLDLKDIIPFPPKPINDLLSTAAATSGGAASSGGYDFNLGLHSAIFMLSEIGLLILQALHALTMCFFDQLYFQHKLAYKKCCNLLSSLSGSPKSEDDKSIKDDKNDEEDLYLCASQDINYKFEIISLMFDLVS